MSTPQTDSGSGSSSAPDAVTAFLIKEEPVLEALTEGRIARVMGWIGVVLSTYGVTVASSDHYQHLSESVFQAIFGAVLLLIAWFKSERTNKGLFHLGVASAPNPVVTIPFLSATTFGTAGSPPKIFPVPLPDPTKSTQLPPSASQ